MTVEAALDRLDAYERELPPLVTKLPYTLTRDSAPFRYEETVTFGSDGMVKPELPEEGTRWYFIEDSEHDGRHYAARVEVVVTCVDQTQVWLRFAYSDLELKVPVGEWPGKWRPMVKEP